MSKIEKINDLVDLLKTGAINQEEFGSLKKEIIHAPEDVEKPIEISEPQTKQEEIPKQQPITTNINKPAQKLRCYETSYFYSCKLSNCVKTKTKLIRIAYLNFFSDRFSNNLPLVYGF